MDSANNQIVSSIVDVNTENIGSAAAVAVAYVYQTMAQAIGLAAYNATQAQQHGNAIGLAVTSKGAEQIMALPVSGS